MSVGFFRRAVPAGGDYVQHRNRSVGAGTARRSRGASNSTSLPPLVPAYHFHLFRLLTFTIAPVWLLRARRPAAKARLRVGSRQEPQDEVIRLLLNARRGTLSWTGYVEHAHLVVEDPSPGRPHIGRVG